VPRPIGEAAYLWLLGFATLREVVFQEVNLEQLQVEFRVEEKNTDNYRNIEELPAKLRFGT
jgi:hypothetical protein